MVETNSHDGEGDGAHRDDHPSQSTAIHALRAELGRQLAHGRQVDLDSVAARFGVAIEQAQQLLSEGLTDLDDATLAPDGDSEASHSAAASHGVAAPDADFEIPLPTSTIRSGASVGDYELLERLASGGMGVVYKARQVSLDRVVALKMILAGEFASPEAVQRFRSETQALGKLQHANIVRVLDSGQFDEQQYYSMDLVVGESLQARLQHAPMEPLEAVEMLIQICRATHYAHENGILHRDLKPANILVDQDGCPRVTDFGLAKHLLDDSSVTATGQVVGTPSYMSPEQARGEPDPTCAADVYSLGAILYCMLTGQPPFRAANPVETLRQVIDRDPVPPSRLNSATPLDLDTICLKCLEKSPAKRYPSALALAVELERVRDHQPILARRASRVERVGKWSRRHPVIAAVSAVVFAAVIATSVLSFRFTQSLQKTNEELAAQNEEADERLLVALDALSDVVIQINGELAYVPNSGATRRRLLDSAIQSLDQLSSKVAGEKSFSATLRARSHLDLARLYHLAYAGDPGTKTTTLQSALEHTEAALKTARALEDVDPPWADLFRVKSMLSRANILFDLNDAKQAEIDGSEAVSLAKERFPGTIVEAEACHNLATIKTGLLKLLEAEALLQNAVRLAGNPRIPAGLNAAFLSRDSVQADVLRACAQYKLADNYKLMNRLDDWKREIGQAQKFFESLQPDQLSNPLFGRLNRSIIWGSIGERLLAEGKISKATDYVDRALKERELLLRAERNNKTHVYHRALLQITKAKLVQRESVPKATVLLKEVVESLQQLVENHVDDVRVAATLADSLLDLSCIYLDEAQPEEAAGYQERARKLFDDVIAKDETKRLFIVGEARCFEVEGDILLRRRQMKQARDAFQKCLDLRQKAIEWQPAVACNNRNLSVAYNKIVMLSTQIGEFDAATEAAERSIETATRQAERDPASAQAQHDLSVALEYRANLEATAGRLDEAHEYGESALAIRRKLFDSDKSNATLANEVASLTSNLGAFKQMQGDSHAAADHIDLAVAIRRELVEQHPDQIGLRLGLVSSLRGQGDVRRRMGEARRAIASFREMREACKEALRKTNRPPMPLLHAYAESIVGMSGCLIQLRDTDKSELDSLIATGIGVSKTLAQQTNDPRMVQLLSEALVRKLTLAIYRHDAERLDSTIQELSDLIDEFASTMSQDNPLVLRLRTQLLAAQGVAASSRFDLEGAQSMYADAQRARESLFKLNVDPQFLDSIRDWHVDRGLRASRAAVELLKTGSAEWSDKDKSLQSQAEAYYLAAGRAGLEQDFVSALNWAEKLAALTDDAAHHQARAAEVCSLVLQGEKPPIEAEEQGRAFRSLRSRCEHFLRQANKGGYFREEKNRNWLRTSPGLAMVRDVPAIQQMAQQKATVASVPD